MAFSCSASPTTTIQHFFRSTVDDGGSTSMTSATQPAATPAATPASRNNSPALPPADDG